MVAADGPAAWVFRERRRGKHVLPPPLGRGVRGFFREGVRQVDAAHPVGTVRLVLGLHRFQVAPEGIVKAIGEHGRSVRAALAVPHVQAPMVEVEFFDPEAQGLREAESASVQQRGNQAIRAGGEGRKEPLHLAARKDRGEAFGAVGAVERADVVKVLAQHLFVEEDEGAVYNHFLPHVRSVRALRAWFWGDAATLRSDARWCRKARMSSSSRRRGWVVSWTRVVAVLATLADPPHLVEELGGLVLGAGHGTRREGDAEPVA